MAELKTKKPN